MTSFGPTNVHGNRHGPISRASFINQFRCRVESVIYFYVPLLLCCHPTQPPKTNGDCSSAGNQSLNGRQLLFLPLSLLLVGLVAAAAAAAQNVTENTCLTLYSPEPKTVPPSSSSSLPLGRKFISLLGRKFLSFVRASCLLLLICNEM
jgi:hypothetical protein